MRLKHCPRLQLLREREQFGQAQEIADTVLEFAVEKSNGVVLPGRFLRRWSTCFAYGSCRIGIFLQRLAGREKRPLFHDLRWS